MTRNPIPSPEDDYPAVLGEVVDAVLADGPDAGREALTPIAWRRREIATRRALGRALIGDVFRRDHFACRYCGAELIPTPIMRLIAGLYPDLFPSELAKRFKESLGVVAYHANALLDVDCIDSPEDTTLNWMPMAVDEQGWQETAEILDRALQDLQRIAVESRERLGEEDGIPVVTGLAAFETPPG